MRIRVRNIKYDTYQAKTGRTAIVFPPLPTKAEIGLPLHPSSRSIGLQINEAIDMANGWLSTSFEYQVEGSSVWTPFECDLRQVMADRAEMIAKRGY